MLASYVHQEDEGNQKGLHTTRWRNRNIPARYYGKFTREVGGPPPQELTEVSAKNLCQPAGANAEGFTGTNQVENRSTVRPPSHSQKNGKVNSFQCSTWNKVKPLQVTAAHSNSTARSQKNLHEKRRSTADHKNLLQINCCVGFFPIVYLQGIQQDNV